MPLLPLNPQQTQEVYAWINQMKLQRTSSQIHRDFSDAVSAAKVVQIYLPNIIEIHNYQPATSTKNKLDNWQTLNHKVLSKLGIKLYQRDMEELSASTPGRIESLLYYLKQKIELMNGDGAQESAYKTQGTEGQTLQRRKPQEQADFYQDIVEVEKPGSQTTLQAAKCANCEEKDRKIKELEDDIKLLEQKVDKLYQLVRLKDGKNKALEQKIEVLQRK